MSIDFDYDRVELHSFPARFRAMGVASKQELQKNLDEIGRNIQRFMITEAPYDSGDLATSVEIRFGHIDYAPGGAGGGGYYEVATSIDVDDVPHLRFVWEGTGIHGPRGSMIDSQMGNVMKFMGSRDGGVLFRKESEGQRPQRNWVYKAQAEAEALMAALVESFDPDL